ncbi:MAG: hypothetical protein OQK78_05615 [Gammaproteobacteria bacterium]|nr:hypothetical protein [Gammaproteobacteria bacterium]
MKLFQKALVALTLFAFMFAAEAASEKYMPFVLAYTATGDVEKVKKEVHKKLVDAKFEVVGSYSPYAGASVFIITNDALKSNAAKSEFGGYGAVQRVSVTKVGSDIQVSYTNPTYMSHAYRMKGDLKDVTKTLEKTLGNKEAFGASKPLRTRKLRKYHYMFGMEYFDDTDAHQIAEHSSHEAAVKAVEGNLAKKLGGVSKVYRVDIPGKDEVVIGVDLDQTPGGDKYMSDDYIMGVIDFKEVKSTAHLPVEILISGDKVYSLYYRFRIAMNFPNLSMMGENSFMNIVESPEAAKTALIAVAGGEAVKGYWD